LGFTQAETGLGRRGAAAAIQGACVIGGVRARPMLPAHLPFIPSSLIISTASPAPLPVSRFISSFYTAFLNPFEDINRYKGPWSFLLLFY
jgi:hypothetical protein